MEHAYLCKIYNYKFKNVNTCNTHDKYTFTGQKAVLAALWAS